LIEGGAGHGPCSDPPQVDSPRAVSHQVGERYRPGDETGRDGSEGRDRASPEARAAPAPTPPRDAGEGTVIATGCRRERSHQCHGTGVRARSCARLIDLSDGRQARASGPCSQVRPVRSAGCLEPFRRRRPRGRDR
jgi:hypothetical protein